MGSGRSIAVQNFNEQSALLVLGGVISAAVGAGFSVYSVIAIFGVVNAGLMWMIKRWHEQNCIRHPAEIQNLLEIARSDINHG